MASLARAYFDDVYARDPDPWGFETRWYEQRKYALTVAALPEPRYRSAFEPGCSIGVLTSMLAPRCERLLATEIVRSALTRAEARLAGNDHVTFGNSAIPESWPEETFDLVVLSEIAYYFDAPTLDDIAGRLVATAVPGASVVAAHWRGETNYPLTGDAAHRVLDARPELDQFVHHEEADFVLDVWRTRQ